MMVESSFWLSDTRYDVGSSHFDCYIPDMTVESSFWLSHTWYDGGTRHSDCHIPDMMVESSFWLSHTWYDIGSSHFDCHIPDMTVESSFWLSHTWYDGGIHHFDCHIPDMTMRVNILTVTYLIWHTSIILSPSFSRPSLYAAPFSFSFVTNMPGSPGRCGISIPPRMLKPRPVM